MELHFETDILAKHSLLVNEFLLLKSIYHKLYLKEDYLSLHLLFAGKTAYQIAITSLVSKDFIKISDNFDYEFDNDFNNVFLKSSSMDLFRNEKDLFLEFLVKFPIKTPSGRILSPVNDDTILGKKIRKKWNILFRGNATKEKKAIAVLEAELQWRKDTNSLEFMNNAYTWLNQGNFESYAYLIEKKEYDYKRLKEDLT